MNAVHMLFVDTRHIRYIRMRLFSIGGTQIEVYIDVTSCVKWLPSLNVYLDELNLNAQGIPSKNFSKWILKKR